MLGDINDREIADEKTIRQYAKGEQQERELRQNADKVVASWQASATTLPQRPISRVNVDPETTALTPENRLQEGIRPETTSFLAYATVNCRRRE
ncbi:hypothetical protein [Klebsiella pneumoniae]|uniref:hypothetical protein n=1 Tax=Klebsiella pneumoniae TaxID=573 RepID=UPI001F21B049